MNIVLGWVRNNLLTVVEIADVIFDALEVVVNGLTRLIPGNKHVILIHDILKKVQGPLQQVKDFLLRRLG